MFRSWAPAQPAMRTKSPSLVRAPHPGYSGNDR